MLLILVSGLGYAVWTDTITTTYILTSAQAPSISVEKGFMNLQPYPVAINVNTSDGTILSTSPDTVRVFINITNTGSTPINTVVVDDALPYDWYWFPENLQVQFIQKDENVIEIGNPCITAFYDSGAHTLRIIVQDIASAVGKYLGTDEKVRVMFNMKYGLKGEPLPQKYGTMPPTYVNTATVTAWIKGWASSPVTTTASFETQINWVGS